MNLIMWRVLIRRDGIDFRAAVKHSSLTFEEWSGVEYLDHSVEREPRAS